MSFAKQPESEPKISWGVKLLIGLSGVSLAVASFSVGQATAPQKCDSKGGKNQTVLSSYIVETGQIPSTDFSPSTSLQAQEFLAKLSAPTMNDVSRILGDKSATVTLVMFEDFSCPFCINWMHENWQKLDKLVKSGKVKVSWSFISFFKEYGSDIPQRAAWALNKQGKMWEFIDAAYKSVAPKEGHPTWTEDMVLALVKNIPDVNMEKFTKDFNSNAAKAEVVAETDNARNFGVNGVPFFIVGDSVISGGQSFEYFKNTVDFQLWVAKHPELPRFKQ